LLRNHNNSLDGEFPITVIEEIFQAGAQQVDDKNVVQTLLAEVVDIWDSSYAVLELCNIDMDMGQRTASD